MTSLQHKMELRKVLLALLLLLLLFFFSLHDLFVIRLLSGVGDELYIVLLEDGVLQSLRSFLKLKNFFLRQRRTSLESFAQHGYPI